MILAWKSDQERDYLFMTRDETRFRGRLTWDGSRGRSHRVFALFLKSFFKLLFNTKGRHPVGSRAHACDRIHRDFFLIAPFFSSMIQGDPLYSPPPPFLPRGFGWRDAAAPAGPRNPEPEPLLGQCHRGPPRVVRFCVFLRTFYATPSVQQPGLDAEEPGRGRR